MSIYYLTLLLYLGIAKSLSFRWSYEDESRWPGRKCNGVGSRQSPIDIQTSDVVRDFRKEFIKYGPLDFDGYHRVMLTATNNDYTIIFRTEGEGASHPMVRGGPLGQEYRLEQMHLHWLSEHAIDGAKFPVEIHFVHVRSDLDVKTALRRKDGLAIIATFCKIIDHEDQIETAFDDLTLVLSKLQVVGSHVTGYRLNLTLNEQTANSMVSIRHRPWESTTTWNLQIRCWHLSKLLSPRTNRYYTYSGSLTSPLCNEVVTWIIFPDHIYLTEPQFNLLEKVREGRYNYRRLQRLDGRRVYQPPSDFLVEPQLVTSLRDAVNTVTEFFANITNFMINGLKYP